MADVVVTLPKSFGLHAWIDEGDPAGAPWSGQEWHFYLGGPVPDMQPGDRVYVVFGNALRGYAPLVRIDRGRGRSFALVRHGGAEAVTIPDLLTGFRGWRYRWWDRSIEMPFPDWRNPIALPPNRCPRCLWPYSHLGCAPDECAYRPEPGTLEHDRVKRYDDARRARQAVHRG